MKYFLYFLLAFMQPAFSSDIDRRLHEADRLLQDSRVNTAANHWRSQNPPHVWYPQPIHPSLNNPHHQYIPRYPIYPPQPNRPQVHIDIHIRN